MLVLLCAGILAAACSGAAAPQPTAKSAKPQGAPTSADVQAGRQLFLAKGCVACHRAPGIPEAQGTIGPNLRGVGNRATHPKIADAVENTPQNMKRWLIDPTRLKPGTSMPGLDLTDDEANKLLALRESFQ